MNRWLQSRVYECTHCEATYVHDRAYHHDLFLCFKRKLAVSKKGIGSQRQTESRTTEKTNTTREA